VVPLPTNQPCVYQLRQQVVVRARYYFTEMCSGPEAGSYLRLIDFCIPQVVVRARYYFPALWLPPSTLKYTLNPKPYALNPKP